MTTRTFKTRINGESIIVEMHGPLNVNLLNIEQCDDCGGSEFSILFSHKGEPLKLTCQNDDCGTSYTLVEV